MGGLAVVAVKDQAAEAEINPIGGFGFVFRRGGTIARKGGLDDQESCASEGGGNQPSGRERAVVGNFHTTVRLVAENVADLGTVDGLVAAG